jgi:hypothetical protein
METEKSVATYLPLPYCEQIAWLHGTYMKDDYLGKGFGAEEQLDRLRVLKERGFDIVLASVITENIPETKIMNKNGWVVLTVFENTCSGHTDVLWMYKLVNLK